MLRPVTVKSKLRRPAPGLQTVSALKRDAALSRWLRASASPRVSRVARMPTPRTRSAPSPPPAEESVAPGDHRQDPGGQRIHHLAPDVGIRSSAAGRDVERGIGILE